MDEQELALDLKVGQLREALAYTPAGLSVRDALRGIDFGLYIVNDELNDIPIDDSWEEVEDGDEDDYDWESEDEYEDYEEEPDNRWDDDEEVCGADPLPSEARENLAQEIAYDIYTGQYDFSTVVSLYSNDDCLLNRVRYIVAYGY